MQKINVVYGGCSNCNLLVCIFVVGLYGRYVFFFCDEFDIFFWVMNVSRVSGGRQNYGEECSFA